jgi:outer membrane protein W
MNLMRGLLYIAPLFLFNIALAKKNDTVFKLGAGIGTFSKSSLTVTMDGTSLYHGTGSSASKLTPPYVPMLTFDAERYLTDNLGLYVTFMPLYDKTKAGVYNVNDTARGTRRVKSPETEIFAGMFGIGPIYKYSGHKLEPYIGATANYIFGIQTNTNYGSTGLTFNRATYGKGGITTVTGHGYSVKAGVQYNITKHHNLSLEYRLVSVLHVHAGTFRSFTNGYSIRDISVRTLMISYGYQL